MERFVVTILFLLFVLVIALCFWGDHDKREFMKTCVEKHPVAECSLAVKGSF